MTSDELIKILLERTWGKPPKQKNLRESHKLMLTEEDSRKYDKFRSHPDINTGLSRGVIIGDVVRYGDGRPDVTLKEFTRIRQYDYCDREPKSIGSPTGPKMMSWHQPIPPKDKAVSAPSRAKKLALRTKRKRKGK